MFLVNLPKTRESLLQRLEESIRQGSICNSMKSVFNESEFKLNESTLLE